MKKVTAILCAAALVGVLPATPALAEGATVTPEGLCFGFIPNADGSIGESLTGQLHSTVTRKGSSSLSCKFVFEPGLIPRTYRARGFPCFTLVGFTDNSSMVASPSGNATLTCKVNVNKAS